MDAIDTKSSTQPENPDHQIMKLLLSGGFNALKFTGRITWKITRIIFSLLVMLFVFFIGMTR